MDFATAKKIAAEATGAKLAGDKLTSWLTAALREQSKIVKRIFRRVSHIF